MTTQHRPVTRPDVLMWEDRANGEILRGYIPESLGLNQTIDSWLRVRPAWSKPDAHGYNINITITEVAEIADRYKPDLASYSDIYKLGKIGEDKRHNYVKQRYDLKGESPILFWGFVNNGDRTQSMEGIHFRSGRILGAIAVHPIWFVNVDKPTDEDLEQHRKQVALIEGFADPKERRIARAASAITNFFGKK